MDSIGISGKSGHTCPILLAAEKKSSRNNRPSDNTIDSTNRNKHTDTADDDLAQIYFCTGTPHDRINKKTHDTQRTPRLIPDQREAISTRRRGRLPRKQRERFTRFVQGRTCCAKRAGVRTSAIVLCDI